ncbi:MAG: class 1 fructose-bisphosphatase [Deltaproteobacteria bacterium]|nr:MAG: class 1 fructose-bisphosphatase [Deltaproteobacteria bacterium]
MATPQFEEGTTLDRFLMDTMRDYPHATGQFVNLMQSISLAGKLIAARVNRAGLLGMLGAVGSTNVHGEYVQRLDLYANEAFKHALEHGGHTCMIVSEEEGGPVLVPSRYRSGEYVVTFDPLDGSSNIDCNITIGSIFCIFRRLTPEGEPAELRDACRAGDEIVASGYLIFGSGTLLVLATEAGVFGFTLDPTVGEFFLSHPNLKIPKGSTYSVNEGHARRWSSGVASYVEALKERSEPWKARYVGSLVADVHRTLLKGGIFLYPATTDAPQGKLRLLYEAFPLAYVIERAGGAATDGERRLLDRSAGDIHDRTPLFIGDADEVARATRENTAAS